jgi:O-acetyl-ADP-ribose deacetylase
VQVSIRGRELELVEGDITLEEIDAIVNAANSALAVGGGVDGAIHRRAGPELAAETAQRYPQGCPTGSAVISGAGNLKASYVIHAVGPVWRGGGEGEPLLLAGAYRRALELASAHGCRGVALPAVSCGVYGYPIDLASRVALTTAANFLKQDPTVARLRFVLFSSGAYGAFAAALDEVMRSD